MTQKTGAVDQAEVPPARRQEGSHRGTVCRVVDPVDAEEWHEVIREHARCVQSHAALNEGAGLDEDARCRSQGSEAMPATLRRKSGNSVATISQTISRSTRK